MNPIGTDISDMMASLERARQASEERQSRRPYREPTPERADKAAEILGRIPPFLAPPNVATLMSRISDQRLRDTAAWWHWERGNLVLLGPSGVGKSTAAAAIVKRMVAMGIQEGGFAWQACTGIRWFAATELELARRQHPLGQGEAPEITRACNARLLVLDNAGWDRGTAAVAHVLDQRMERGLQTIVASAMRQEDLLRHYRDEVVRRIIESGGKQARVVDCFPKPQQQTLPVDGKSAAGGG